MIRKTAELAYLIGVMQGDGSLYKYTTMNGGKRKPQVRHVLMLNAMDLEMVRRCRDLFFNVFGRNRRICRRSSGIYSISYCVKTLLGDFKQLDIIFRDPPVPPNWIKNKRRFFGPYLAGLIDSDGSVCIKRPAYPQCSIKITSGHRQRKLKETIRKILRCGVFIEKQQQFNKYWKIHTLSFHLRFVVSLKNMDFFGEYVLPWMTIPRKRNVIARYIQRRAEEGI